MSDKDYNDLTGWSDIELENEYHRQRDIVKKSLDDAVQSLIDISYDYDLTHYKFYHYQDSIYLTFGDVPTRLKFYQSSTPEDMRIFIILDSFANNDELSVDMSGNQTVKFLYEYIKFIECKQFIEEIIPVIQNAWKTIGTAEKIYNKIIIEQHRRKLWMPMRVSLKKDYVILGTDEDKIYITVTVPDDLSSVFEHLDESLYEQKFQGHKVIIIDYYVRNGLDNRFFIIPYIDGYLHLSETQKYHATDKEVKLFEDYFREHLEIIDRSINPSKMKERYKNKLTLSK